MARRQGKRTASMPKREYFEMRLRKAEASGNTRKAAYYRSRLRQLPHTGHTINETPSEIAERVATASDKREALRAKIAAMTSEERIQRCIKIINDSHGTQGQKRQYIMDECGVDVMEYMEALNRAGDGELLRSALGG